MRRTGVLSPVFSLPGENGVGDFGKVAYKFIDTLEKNGVKLWQILPLNPVGYGNSPYQPYSSYAGDEIYIALDGLVKDKLLRREEVVDHVISSTKVDYEVAREMKTKYLRLANARLVENKRLYSQFTKFLKENEWVETYAVFITFKKLNDLQCWLDWPEEFKGWIDTKALDLTPYEADIQYEKFVQFMFYKQWFALKTYANSKGIEIMGDIPIYVGIDSADVWVNKCCFLLDDKSHPTYIAGVPPDYFSETGQRWGNPLYDWEYLEKTGFQFWMDRLAFSNSIYDIIRIDHFRAFDTYWKIPASCPTAIEGEWVEAPGYALFDEIYKQMPDIKIVAEDLGDLRPEVLELRDHYKLSGMKIVQFSLDPNETNNDFDETQRTIVYTGTHDNQTIAGWYEALSANEQRRIRRQYSDYSDARCVNRIIHKCMHSPADLVILPIQDIIGLRDEARLNTPGTIGSPNWEWKLENYKMFNKKMKTIKQWIEESNR